MAFVRSSSLLLGSALAAAALAVGCGGGGGRSGPAPATLPSSNPLATVAPGTLPAGTNLALTLLIPARGASPSEVRRLSAARRLSAIPPCTGTLGVRAFTVAAYNGTPFPIASAVASPVATAGTAVPTATPVVIPTVLPSVLPSATFVAVPTPGPAATTVTVALAAPVGYDVVIVEAYDGGSGCTPPSPVPSPGNILAGGIADIPIYPNTANSGTASMYNLVKTVTLTGPAGYLPGVPLTSSFTARAYDADNMPITGYALNAPPLVAPSPVGTFTSVVQDNEPVYFPLPAGASTTFPITANVTYPVSLAQFFNVSATPSPTATTIYTLAPTYVLFVADGSSLYAIDPNGRTAQKIGGVGSVAQLATGDSATCGAALAAVADPASSSVDFVRVTAIGTAPPALAQYFPGVSGVAVDRQTCTTWAVGVAPTASPAANPPTWNIYSNIGLPAGTSGAGGGSPGSPGPAVMVRNVVIGGATATSAPLALLNSFGYTEFIGPSPSPSPVPLSSFLPDPYTSIDGGSLYADDDGVVYYGSTSGVAAYTYGPGPNAYGTVLEKVNLVPTPIPYATPGYFTGTKNGRGRTFAGFGTTLYLIVNAGSSVQTTTPATWPATIKGLALSPDNAFLWVNQGGGQIVAYPASAFMSGVPPTAAPSPAAVVTLPPGFAGTGGRMSTSP